MLIFLLVVDARTVQKTLNLIVIRLSNG